tara:strand:+ start:664 stop:867 length:204 start_codon:yes stop_codon:yes gene_type:complete
MKLIKVRVNKTVEYEVSMGVDNDHKYEQVFDYLQTIDWDREIVISPQNYKHIAEYYDWLDWETEDND